MNDNKSITWERIIPNISVRCTALESITFDGFTINQGAVFEGTYRGMTEDDEPRVILDVTEMQKKLGIHPHLLQAVLPNAHHCFRCDRYAAQSEFYRSAHLRDKSPILTQICSDCYKRAQNQVSSRNNQANRIGAENTLKTSEWLEKLLASQGHCYYCKQYIGCANLIIEHMTPISWKGGHTKENIVPACIPCNSSKGDRDIETWQRSIEAKQLLELLQDHFQLGKTEVTNLAIKRLAIHAGLSSEDTKEVDGGVS